ncbi:sigma 54-interacting transcriptional regulator [Acidaminobacter hydrogenoformans]|uniref:sigma 54-interacting transcriptional regulator n=1 Tax=Acidaminobacter hydrogenoformans TaxID=65403 RepID=UPI000B87FC70|nr:sigma 54-interacting transcriptional regulator [Acidaminobacter hydrogenoformans]
MRNDIILISTSSSLSERIKEVLKHRNLDFPVFEATMDTAYEIATKSIRLGTKVIVCRGGTASYLRDKVDVPVVDIRHGFIDIHMSMEKALKVSPRVGVIGYSNLCEAASDYKKIMNSNFPIAEVSNDTDIERKLVEFIELGIEVVIGGLQLSEAAKKYNICQIMGEADPAAINQSLNEALHDLKIENERKEKFETINSILNCTSEGIVGIEKNGRIMHINDIAKKMLKYTNQDYIKEIIPTSLLFDTLKTGVPHFNELTNVGDNSVVICSVPIAVEGNTIGVVVTIQEENKIQTLDREIRKKHLSTGHIAKKTFKDIVGNSKKINEVVDRAVKYSKTDSTILILGETGVGKEVFAQSIHNHSVRKNQPFVAINCAALPENILESELFGYVKGAFTGARNEGKAGIFELAHMGTVFLDEIGEISTNVQVKLLRVLQEKEVSRIGDDKIFPIDVRVLAASNKNLIEEIRRGNFREDLYYRLCVLELEIPPLRERKDDISDLLNFFISNNKKRKIEISQDAIALLCNYEWPGNVRQLSNIVERLLVNYDGGAINKDQVAELLKNIDYKKEHFQYVDVNSPSKTEEKLISLIEKIIIINDERQKDGKQSKYVKIENNQPKIDSVVIDEAVNKTKYEHWEIEIIKDALRESMGKREQAAELLGISTTTLWRKMKKLNIRL